MDALDTLIYGLQGKARPDEEVYGGEEILGSEEILGVVEAALSSAKMKSGSAFQNALAQRLAKRAPVTQRVTPTKKRRFTIGFGPATVPPLSTITVQSQPQVLFRGEKIINTGDSTGLFIQGLFVGNKPQLPTFQSSIAVGTYNGGVLDNEQLLDQHMPRLAA